jgi:4-hydroxybenzoate polyprenyltransferase
MSAEIKSSKSSNSVVPLCVDLDGTLLRTDILLESIYGLMKKSMFYAFLLPIWLLMGKAYFKQQIADRVDIEASLLPYNEPFLAFLKKKKETGHPLVLATASNIKYAQQIAQNLKIFDEVMASDKKINLSGHQKRMRLLNAYGEKGFDYAGNASVDLKIWPHAREAVLVNPEAGIQRNAKKIAKVIRVFKDQRSYLRSALKTLRIHQWLKNLLLFIPLLMAHKFQDAGLLLQTSLGFLAFGLCASSVYILNDLLDLPSDRAHPTKRHRPLASGNFSIKHATLLFPLLLSAAFAISTLLPVAFIQTLALYYVVTLAYSLRLKQILLADVLALAGLYTVRIGAGAYAVGLTPSSWLLAFSMFLFLSLALVKRYSELLITCKANNKNTYGRSYRVTDLESLSQFGAASGYMSVLVLALYIDSDQIKTLYARPEVVWLLCPILLYWISRVWILTRRGQMHDDPVIFAIKDRKSYLLGVIALLILWVAL